MEAKIEFIATAAGLITDEVAEQNETDASNMDPWSSWNVCRDVANAVLEEDVENVIDRLVDLQILIAEEVAGLQIEKPTF
jgi:hypothetical protein